MKKTMIAMLSLAILSGSPAAAAGHDAARDEAQIRALIQGTTDAYARLDAKGAMAAYLLDPKLHVFDVMLPVQHFGYLDNLKSTQDVMDASTGPITMIYQNPVVEVDGDHAYSYAVVHMVAHMKNGSTTDTLVRNTDVWKRFGDKWLIIHEHNSFPLDAEAGARLVNATPR